MCWRKEGLGVIPAMVLPQPRCGPNGSAIAPSSGDIYVVGIGNLLPLLVRTISSSGGGTAHLPLKISVVILFPLFKVTSVPSCCARLHLGV